MSVSGTQSPSEFLGKLRSGTLGAPIQIVGMVREVEERDDRFEFTFD
ncbi:MULTISPECIES: hypothetical protein [unclassified Streptomyces]|nr:MULTISPECIES: hypothetical protein [unclassified Streptomyces]